MSQLMEEEEEQEGARALLRRSSASQRRDTHAPKLSAPPLLLLSWLSRVLDLLRRVASEQAEGSSIGEAPSPAAHRVLQRRSTEKLPQLLMLARLREAAEQPPPLLMLMLLERQRREASDEDPL